jgi:hypothetical protein
LYIYTITGVEELDDKYGTTGSIRCFGYYSSFNTADIAVKQNTLDIHEYLYDYMVIEKVEEGLYPICLDRWFYKWHSGINQFVPMEEPECLKHIINLGIG